MRFNDVNQAFDYLVDEFHEEQQELENRGESEEYTLSPSRVGNVVQYLWPSVITFLNPCKRVLFNQTRDCNPFFHLYEALWMLAGRQDIKPLAYFSSGYAKQVQDGNNPNANGAYGYRWRKAKYEIDCNTVTLPDDRMRAVDQLQIIINELKRDPTSRRCVLQMWNVEDDLLKMAPEMKEKPNQNYSKDVACNTAAYFLIRTGDMLETGDGACSYLDMTVTNRSNDLVWGMLGANVVHFSFLQEYMAAALGVGVGRYHQVTNNLHVYTDRFPAEEWLKDDTENHYESKRCHMVPLVRDFEQFNDELPKIVANNYGPNSYEGWRWKEPFFNDVAQPMFDAFHAYKDNELDAALDDCSEIKASDWRIAAQNWLTKRKENRERKAAAAN